MVHTDTRRPSSDHFRSPEVPGGKRFLQSWMVVMLLAGALLAFMPGWAGAQELAATLSGTVTDTSGAIIPRDPHGHAERRKRRARVVESGRLGQLCRDESARRNLYGERRITGFDTYLAKNVVLNVAESAASIFS